MYIAPNHNKTNTQRTYVNRHRNSHKNQTKKINNPTKSRRNYKPSTNLKPLPTKPKVIKQHQNANPNPERKHNPQTTKPPNPHQQTPNTSNKQLTSNNSKHPKSPTNATHRQIQNRTQATTATQSTQTTRSTKRNRPIQKPPEVQQVKLRRKHPAGNQKHSNISHNTRIHRSTKSNK